MPPTEWLAVFIAFPDVLGGRPGNPFLLGNLSVFGNFPFVNICFFPGEYHYYGPWSGESWRWSWEIGGGPMARQLVPTSIFLFPFAK